LGTFCVFDKKPRTLPAEDRQLLKDLARLAEQELAVSETLLAAIQ
jgi:GAF domain-containing protein